jgi:hypothetical protein
MLFKIILFQLINSIFCFSLYKINQTKILPEIIIVANGSNIINITMPDFNNIDVSKKYQYRVTINQLAVVDNNDTSAIDENIKDSARLAAKTAALIKTPVFNDVTKNDQFNNFVLTLVYLIKTTLNNETKDTGLYSYQMTIDPVLNPKPIVNQENFIKKLTAIKFVNNSRLARNDTSKSSREYDSKGAIIYIWVIISFYSSFVLLLLILRVKPTLHKIPYEDTDREKAEGLMRNAQEDAAKRKILEQLRNETYRKKAWKIYHSNRDIKNDLMRNIREENTIKHLHKKLENMKLKHEVDRDPFKLTMSPLTRSFFQIGYEKQEGGLMKNDECKEVTTNRLRDWARSFESKFSSAIRVTEKNCDDVWQQNTSLKSTASASDIIDNNLNLQFDSTDKIEMKYLNSYLYGLDSSNQSLSKSDTADFRNKTKSFGASNNPHIVKFHLNDDSKDKCVDTSTPTNDCYFTASDSPIFSQKSVASTSTCTSSDRNKNFDKASKTVSFDSKAIYTQIKCVDSFDGRLKNDDEML